MATFNQQRDAMVCCPYDSSHRVASRNFVKHAMQCELKYTSGYVVVCPHNASHRIPKHELANHLKRCDDLKQITRERAQYSNANTVTNDLKNLTVNNGAESEDSWSEDDAPHYDIYSCIAVSDPTKHAANKPQDNDKKTIVGQIVRETKNQKKRRKRKENAKTTKTQTETKVNT